MVTKGNKSDSGKELVGVLNKPDIGLNTQGKVGDYVRSPIRYIQEDETIESALAKFSLTGQILFVVINPKRDIVGYLTLKEALSSILSPDTLDSEPNDHDDSKTLGLIEVEPGGYK